MPRCAVALRSRFQNGMVVTWHGRGRACVNQTRPHCVNQSGKTQSKPLAARHGKGNGMGSAWERHGMCELALSLVESSSYRCAVRTKFIDVFRMISNINNHYYPTRQNQLVVRMKHVVFLVRHELIRTHGHRSVLGCLLHVCGPFDKQLIVHLSHITSSKTSVTISRKWKCRPFLR
jgi:hypothetical protein